MRDSPERKGKSLAICVESGSMLAAPLVIQHRDVGILGISMISERGRKEPSQALVVVGFHGNIRAVTLCMLAETNHPRGM